MDRPTAFYAADQPLVNQLCNIIFQLELVMSVPPEKVFNDPAELALLKRITRNG